MKTIVITGSTRGIGLGLATYFLKNNCQVVINGTSKSSIEKALEKLEPYTSKGLVIGILGDVSKYETHELLAQKALETYKKLIFGSIMQV
jgi:3-oxoacyl-[acyl-carrier protein] reductase